MAVGDHSADYRSGDLWLSSDFEVLAERPGRGWMDVREGRASKRVPPIVRVHFSPDADTDRHWARELAAGRTP
jgi:hypothetical protein